MGGFCHIFQFLLCFWAGLQWLVVIITPLLLSSHSLSYRLRFLHFLCNSLIRPKNRFIVFITRNYALCRSLVRLLVWPVRFLSFFSFNIFTIVYHVIIIFSYIFSILLFSPLGKKWGILTIVFCAVLSFPVRHTWKVLPELFFFSSFPR